MSFAGHAGLRLRDGELSEGTAHAWLHASSAVGHEFHAGVGSFAAAVGRIEAGGVAVSTLLTRSNARVLLEMPGWLRGRGVTGWRIVVPRVVGTVVRAAGGVQVVGVGALDGLVPRLSVALPAALQALMQARRVGLMVGIEGAPLCLLGPFAGVSLGGDGVYAAACEGCAARGRCPGVDAGYLRRFGGDELSPRGLRAAEGGAPDRGLFLGTGVLEQVGEDMSLGTGGLEQVGEDMSLGTGGSARRHLPIVAEGGRG